MSDPAQINRSLSTIRTELEYLASSGVLAPPQMQSIQAQLPVRNRWPRTDYNNKANTTQQTNGQPSQYIDPRYVSGNQQFNPAWISQQAQDPNNPAHPQHPKVSTLGSTLHACQLRM
jgi:hypothetical protein